MTLGTLEIDNGATLEVIGNSSATFSSTTVDPNGAAMDVTAGVNTAVDVYAGTYYEGAVGCTFTESGTGNLIFDDNTNEPDDDATPFDLQGGALVVVQTPAGAGPLPTADFSLNGGQLVLATADGSRRRKKRSLRFARQPLTTSYPSSIVATRTPISAGSL